MAERKVPAAKAFSEGLRVPPVLHGGFLAAYEGLSGALAAGNPLAAVVSTPGLGKSTLLGTLPALVPDASHARLLQDRRVVLTRGEITDLAALSGMIHGSEKKGLVVSLELHGAGMPVEQVNGCLELLFDLATEGVSMVIAGTAEEVEGIAAAPAAESRDPVRLQLEPVPVRDTFRYVHSRLSAAGAEGWTFSEEATSTIGIAAGGIPVRINCVCRKVLTAAYLEGRTEIGPEDVEVLSDAG